MGAVHINIVSQVIKNTINGVTIIIAVFVFLLFGKCNNENPSIPSILKQRRIILFKDTILHNGKQERLFNFNSELAVDTGHRLYVTAPNLKTIEVYSPDYKLTHTIGRTGRGPGEFMKIDGVSICCGDSLYVYDFHAMRISVFDITERPAFEYSMSIPIHGKGLPHEVFKPDTTGLLIQYLTPPFRQSRSYENTWLTRIDHNGNIVNDSVLVAPADEFYVIRGNGGTAHIKIPFGRSSIVKMAKNGSFYYGWNENIEIYRLSVGGDTLSKIKLPYDPPNVSTSNIDSSIESRSQSRFGTVHRKAIKNADIPDRKPAFNDYIPDNNRNVWIDIVSSADTSEWLILDAITQNLVKTSLPRSVSIETVIDNKVYAYKNTGRGTKKLIVYTFRAFE